MRSTAFGGCLGNLIALFLLFFVAALGIGFGIVVAHGLARLVVP